MYTAREVALNSPVLRADQFLEHLRSKPVGQEVVDQVYNYATSSFSMMSYFRKMGKVKTATSESPTEITINTKPLQTVKLLEVRSSDDRVGYNRRPFIMVFQHRMFDANHVIFGKVIEYQIQIKQYLGEETTGHAYEAVIFGNSTSAFIPRSILEDSDNEWQVMTAFVSNTESVRGPSVTYSAPNKRVFPLGMVRFSDTVPGDAAFVPYQVSWNTKNGNTFSTWDDKRTFEFTNQAYRAVERAIVWSNPTVDEKGNATGQFDAHSKKIIKNGPSIWSQLNKGTVVMYRFGSSMNSADTGDDVIELIEANVNNLRYGKVAMDVSNHIMVSTGTAGMAKASVCIGKRVNSYVRATETLLGKSSMIGGTMFTRWLTPTGLTIDFRYEPSFDEQQIGNKLPGGIYEMSATYMILDMGTTDNEDSIYIEEGPRQLYSWYYMEGPVGSGSKGTNRSKAIASIPGMKYTKPVGNTMNMLTDAWEETFLHQFRVVVKTPMNCMLLRPTA